MHIAIIGCGYIGTALAIELTKKGHIVTATTRSREKVKPLVSIVQKCIILKGNNQQELLLLAKENDYIILTVSANDYTYEHAYLDTTRSLRYAAISLKKPKKLIFTSNANIYGHQQGLWVDEKAKLTPPRYQEQILLEAENTLLSLEKHGWGITIFRLGEIYGPKRELSLKSYFIKKYINAGYGRHYTNMIHQEDIIRAICYAIEHNLKGIYNLADDDHLSNEQFYKIIQKKMQNLPTRCLVPFHYEFGNKRVSNHKIKSEGFIFKYPIRQYY